jgi:hypothetical protein
MDSNSWTKLNYRCFSWFEETVHEQPYFLESPELKNN